MLRRRFSSVRQQVYQTLKQALVSGAFAPGERINPDQVAKRYHVSRTPVWEAFHLLRGEGLVEILPRRGIYAVDFSPAQIRELFLLREHLEGLAAHLAAENASVTHLSRLDSCLRKQQAAGTPHQHAALDRQFHALILTAARSPRLQHMLETLWEQMLALRLRSVFLPSVIQHGLIHHRQVYAAIAERDPTLAEQQMRRHVRDVMQALLMTVESHGIESFSDYEILLRRLEVEASTVETDARVTEAHIPPAGHPAGGDQKVNA